jgi:hypothetical protein
MNLSSPRVGVQGRGYTVTGKTARSTRLWNEEQLDFPFLSETDPSTGTVAEAKSAITLRMMRTSGKPRGLAGAVAAAQATLLGAPIEEVSAQLLPLLEFCEAALTRALDAVPRRAEGLPFSHEEYRSLRGIGQAQWLLVERQVEPEAALAVKKARGGKKRNENRAKPLSTDYDREW